MCFSVLAPWGAAGWLAFLTFQINYIQLVSQVVMVIMLRWLQNFRLLRPILLNKELYNVSFEMSVFEYTKFIKLNACLLGYSHLQTIVFEIVI